MYVYGLVGYFLAFAVIACYNGQRGFIKGGKCTKYGSYAYYPAHLMIIWCWLH